jgi:DNA-binding response OmpR family regulator
MAHEDVILLVEDNADDACILGIALRKAGITNRMEILRNPVEAMRYLEGEGPYVHRTAYPLPALLIISADLRLVSGLEILRWVGRRPHLRGLPVVLLSDFPLNDGSLEGLPPIARMVVKPSGFSELVAFMHSLRFLLPNAPLPVSEWRLAS